MKADGSIVRCSGHEEKELFSLVLGGYGLFGVILDVELTVVPNERYRHESEVLPADRYVAAVSGKSAGHSPMSAWSTGGCRSCPAKRFCERRS